MASGSLQGRIVIAGGSGFVGISLATYLASAGASVVILSRKPPKVSGPWRHVGWDGCTLGDWRLELDGAVGLVNLAGRSVDCIKTPDHQDEILRSRVEATRVLGLAVRSVDSPPPVWVQMSTAHIYGDPTSAVCSEESPCGFGLAPFVGQAWEAEFRAGILPRQRGVIFRTSFVLGRDRGVGCGALARLQKIVRLGLGGRVGSGTQGISWIHEVDLNRLIERALTDSEPIREPSQRGGQSHFPPQAPENRDSPRRFSKMSGTYIASSPNPVPQREFMRQLRRAMRVPIGLPAYAWMVRFGARWLLRTDPELALYGRHVVSRRLADEGFEFRFPRLSNALVDILG